MAYFIRLELKEDVEWLESLLGNSVQKLRSGSPILEAASGHIVRVHDAILNAVPTKEADSLGITQEEFPEDIKKPVTKKKSTKSKEKEWVPNLCETHPKNEIKRPPRTDCEGCWTAYKRLHPLEYDKNRRSFERRQKD